MDIDGDGIADDPWDFGTGSRYPILKADWDGDGTATSQEFDAQTTLQVTAQSSARAIGAEGIMVGVAENTAPGTDIGDPFGSADPQTGDALTYSLGGDDAGHFSIDSATGQLRTKGALDYEDKSSYSVTVIATDGDGQTTDIQVTIIVTNVADTPPGQPDAPEIINVKETSFRVTWTAPAAGSSAITGYGIQYKLASAEDSAYADVKPTPTGTGTGYNVVNRSGQTVAEGTSYAVRVRAKNTEGWGPWSAAATVTTDGVADTPPGQPAAPEIINVKETSFRITWTAPAAGSSAITGYGIQYKPVSAADAAYADVKPTPTGTGTGYNVVNRSGQTVASGTSYAVRVRASNAEGWGPWSDAAFAVTVGAAPAPINQAPAFAAATATVSVAENIAANTNIGSPVKAADPDGDTLTYTLGTTADDGHFAIDSSTGQLQTQGALDYEGKASYSVTVTATDGGGLSASIQVTIDVTDVNQAPAFAAATATVSVAENTAANTNIGSPVTAADPDDGDTLTYTLGTTADDGHFAIDSASGQLQTKGALDYEGKASYSVTVTATDGGGLSASIGVTITVTDVADTPPGQPAAPEIINVQQTSFRVTWTAPTVGSSPITGYGIQYKLTSAEDSAYADVKPTPTGIVTGYNLVNRSGQTVAKGTSYTVRVRARNTEGWGPWSEPAVAATAGAAPAPANQAPAFAAATATVSVAENTAANTNIGSPVTAADPDDGDTLTYTLGTTADDGHFAIDSVTGQLRTKGALDYEGKASYSVTVTATDGGGLSASIGVTITVTDVADTPPGQPAAPEIINVKETSFRVTWTAPTVGSSAITGYGIQYKLTSAEDSAYADVKPTPTGTVTGYNLVNRSGQTVAKGTSYTVRVRARNTEGWGPWSDAAVAATAGAAPAPANQAPAFAAATATVSVAENTAANTNIGSPVKAADPDGDTLTYTLGTTADDGHFAIDSASGQLQTQGALDYEGKASYSVTVTATDGGGLSASIGVTITVTDVADTPPGQPAAPEIINVKETSFRITWTAPAEGSSAITGYGIQYKLVGAEDSAYADVKPTPTGIGTGYNLVNRNGQTVAEGTSYDVRVRASNAEGWGPWSEPAVAATAGAAPAPINQAPAFAAATATVSVAENTAANTNIGSPVTAADPDDGDTLTYTLGATADDGHFAIDSASGQLQTKGALDYEGKSSYSVTVTATDGGGLSASIGVTITVTDVADTPPGQPAAPEIINVKETSFRITWTAPAEGSSAITGYGIQYKLASAEDSAYADVKPTPTGIGTGYNLVNRNGQTVAEGTSYDVRVRASNAEGWGPWSEPAVAATAGAAESDEGGTESGDYQATAFYVESQGRVILQWDEVSKADHYTIEKNGQLLPGKFRATSHYDDDVEKNTRYEYRITAYSGDGAVLAVMRAATG